MKSRLLFFFFLTADDRKGAICKHVSGEEFLRPGHISVRQNEGKPWLPLTASQASTLIEMFEELKNCSALGETVAFSGLLFLFPLTWFYILTKSRF